MKSRHRRIGIVLVATVLVATALAGGALAALVAQRSTMATKIPVKEVNYKIVLKKHTFAKGKVVFVVHNASNTAHEFKIKGPSLSKRIPGLINPGQTKSLTVTLRKGTYVLSCPIHVALGMKTSIRAGGATTSTGGTTTGSTWG